ncbi:Glycosylphosphatidylinositol (GPI) anchor assembly protein [Teratosphaeriaceae sp. CCFEE 6253]|nr:Glycosylphosphatidylinositol (GPI) anchor assembly protein [Teratosphaeriaceae sp. CCFEE 6253]
MDHSIFLDLPPELRLRIYEYALPVGKDLRRPVGAATRHRSQGYAANISLLCASRLLYREARDVFYAVNSFVVAYNDICSCDGEKPFPPLEQRMGEIHITNIILDSDEPRTCKFCDTYGVGLLSQLVQVPTLRAASIDFEHTSSFAMVAHGLQLRQRALSAAHQTELLSDEVGEVQIRGWKLQLTLKLAPLHRAWAALAGSEKGEHARRRGPRDHSMRRTLEHLQCEADDYNLTGDSILPFIVPHGQDGTRALCFRGLPVEKSRRAAFTIALAWFKIGLSVDGGNVKAITWTEIDGLSPYGADRWTFSEEKYGPYAAE